MNCTCPHCDTMYRVDPRKVPAAGVRARCSTCQGVFQVRRAADEQPAGAAATPRVEKAAAPAAGVAPAPAAPGPAAAQPVPSGPAPGPVFGAADPHGKARRLARALISDIVVYHPERRERSLREGTLRTEFREEIRKSWEEYVAQVGDSIARGSPYFREALNEILAGGSPVF